MEKVEKMEEILAILEQIIVTIQAVFARSARPACWSTMGRRPIRPNHSVSQGQHHHLRLHRHAQHPHRSFPRPSTTLTYTWRCRLDIHVAARTCFQAVHTIVSSLSRAKVAILTIPITSTEQIWSVPNPWKPWKNLAHFTIFYVQFGNARDTEKCELVFEVKAELSAYQIT